MANYRFYGNYIVVCSYYFRKRLWLSYVSDVGGPPFNNTQ